MACADDTAPAQRASVAPDARERLAGAYDHATQYLLGRQCANGGFCFYRSEHLEEANLADTYHAVSALKVLGQPLPRAAQLIAFVDRFPPTAQPSELYYFTMTKRLIEPAFCPDERVVRAIRGLRLSAPPSASRVSGWVQRARWVARLKRDFADPLDGDAIRGFLESVVEDGGFGSRPNLEDTWLALEILAACGDARAIASVAGFVDRLQSEPFGFTGTLIGTTANVDVILAGVRSCALLGLPVRYPELAIRFLLQCQTSRGGFSRAPDALPSIEYTYEALAALVALAPESAQATFTDGNAAH